MDLGFVVVSLLSTDALGIIQPFERLFDQVLVRAVAVEICPEMLKQEDLFLQLWWWKREGKAFELGFARRSGCSFGGLLRLL